MNDLKQLFRSADEPSRRDFVSHAAKACLGVGFVASGGVASNAIAAAGTKAYKGGGTAKNVIYLYMGGGMSHLDTFDPKPGAKTQGPVEAIKTKSGVMVSERLRRSLGLTCRSINLLRSRMATTSPVVERSRPSARAR